LHTSMKRWIGTAGTLTHSRTRRWRTSDMIWFQSMRRPGPYPVGTPGLRTQCPQLRRTQTLHHYLNPLQSITSHIPPDASLNTSPGGRHSPTSLLTSVTMLTLKRLRLTSLPSSPSRTVLHTSCAPPECVVCEGMPSLP
jgi:hypothetical protein